MAKLTFKTENCKGCGLCVSACSKKLLAISSEIINQKGHYVAYLTDQEACNGCANCATMCPDCVIRVER